MSIADKILRLQKSKNDIADSIIAKGGTVMSSDGFEEFSVAISTIPTESGASYKTASGTLMIGNHNHFTISHNLNSDKIIVFVQAVNNSTFTAQYKMINGIWISEPLKLLYGILDTATFNVPYSTTGNTTVNTNIRTLTNPVQNTRPAAQASIGTYITHAGSIETTATDIASNRLVIVNNNTVECYSVYSSENNVTYHWSVIAF